MASCKRPSGEPRGLSPSALKPRALSAITNAPVGIKDLATWATPHPRGTAGRLGFTVRSQMVSAPDVAVINRRALSRAVLPGSADIVYQRIQVSHRSAPQVGPRPLFQLIPQEKCSNTGRPGCRLKRGQCRRRTSAIAIRPPRNSAPQPAPQPPSASFRAAWRLPRPTPV